MYFVKKNNNIKLNNKNNFSFVKIIVHVRNHGYKKRDCFITRNDAIVITDHHKGVLINKYA